MLKHALNSGFHCVTAVSESMSSTSGNFPITVRSWHFIIMLIKAVQRSKRETGYVSEEGPGKYKYVVYSLFR